MANPNEHKKQRTNQTTYTETNEGNLVECRATQQPAGNRDGRHFIHCVTKIDLVTSTALGLCLTLYRHLQLPIPATSVHCTTTQIIFYITAIFLDYVGCPKVRGMRTFSYNTVLNIAFKKKKLNRNLKFSNVETRNRRIFSATYV